MREQRNIPAENVLQNTDVQKNNLQKCKKDLCKSAAENLQKYLSQICATDVQKRKLKVINDLQFFCKLSESEAVTIWNEAIAHGLLTLYTTWEQDDRFKTYSYNGVFTGESTVSDFTDKGMSNTYHNTKTPESLKFGKYGNDRKENVERLKPRKAA